MANHYHISFSYTVIKEL